MEGKIKVKIYGNRYLPSVIQHSIASQGLQEIVEVYDPVSHQAAVSIVQQSDLSFLTLPDRLHPKTGGRISAKTYEYLMSDRPILAAIPQGENWNYLADKPGVWRVSPRDTAAMATIVEQLAARKFAGQSCRYDRTDLRQELSYATLADAFSKVLSDVI